MKIVLESEEELAIYPTDGPLNIEAASPELSYSAFQMLGSSLGTCVLSVLYSWADQAELPTDDMSVRVKWHFTDEPHRVDRYDLTIDWPGLPEERRAAAGRVAEMCAVHETLHHPPEIQVQLGDR